jgi:5,5'-dehydrodivanillate O-demethylase
LQDAVVMVGQDVIAHRDEEHLGRSDVGVIFIRELYKRELRALAEGRPVKQWVHIPEDDDRDTR